MEFKDKLKDLRKQKKLTQDALAFEIHVSRSTIAKWEAGLGLPQQDSIEDLCLFFNVSKEELISSNYKEETLIIKNLKIHSLSKKMVGLSITFSLILILTIIITSLIVSRIKDVDKMSDIYSSIKLTNHINVNSKYVATAGKIEAQETFLNYEYGYSYQNIEFQKIKYTDKSSLVLIAVHDLVVPGGVAFANGSSNHKQNSKLDFCYTEISFNENVNIIYSWPNLESKWIRIHSLYSENIVYDFSMNFTMIHIQKLNDQLQFYYEDSFDDFILSHDKKEIIREFDYEYNNYSTLWSYRMYGLAKDLSFNMRSFYLVEVNENELPVFELNILTGMSSGKHEIKRRQNIVCYL